MSATDSTCKVWAASPPNSISRDWRSRPRFKIQTLLALREISIQEDLQATDEQVDAEFDRLLAEGTLEEEQYAEFKADGRRRLQVANALIQQRLHDFLFSHNTITRSNSPPCPIPKRWKTLWKTPKRLPPMA